MAKERCAESWDHTAALLALTINMNRKKGAKAVAAVDFNPYRHQKKSQPKLKLNKADSMALLKRVFIDHKPVDLNALQQGKIQ